MRMCVQPTSFDCLSTSTNSSSPVSLSSVAYTKFHRSGNVGCTWADAVRTTKSDKRQRARIFMAAPEIDRRLKADEMSRMIPYGCAFVEMLYITDFGAR